MDINLVKSRFVVKLAVPSTENINISPDLLAQLITGFDSIHKIYFRGEIDYQTQIINNEFERSSPTINTNNLFNQEYKSFLSYRVDPYHWQANQDLNKFIVKQVYTSRQIKLKPLNNIDINITDKNIIQNIINYCKDNKLKLIANYLSCCVWLQDTLQSFIEKYNQNNLPRQTNLKPLIVYNYNYQESF